MREMTAARSPVRVLAEPVSIMHVAESSGWAGGEAYLLKLAATLDRSRFRLAVVVPEPGPLVTRLDALGVPTWQVPLTRRLVSVGALRGLIALFRRERPALVQSHGARSNVYTKLAGWFARVPVIVATVHNSLFDYEVSALRRRLYVWAEVATGPLADRIVAVSFSVAHDLIHRYGLQAAKVVTIQNGIDSAAFAPQRPGASVLEELGLRADDRLIGVAARMTPQKGHAVLLQALGRLVPRFPRVRCLLIGDGPLEPSLRRQALELGLVPHCLFTGARSDVADLLSVLEIVVLPSRSEGLPFTLLEAMALGKPVVATNVGGNVEVVKDGKTGLLTPPGDPNALADALAFLLDHPQEAIQMGEWGRIRVREHFSLDRMIHALEDLYISALATRN